MRRLIINADDFGLNPGSNRAIVECFDAGALTSASLMMGMAGTEEAIALAATRPGLGLAVHLNLTCGRPLAPAAEVPSIVDSAGRFFTRSALERRSLLMRVRPVDVLREWRDQVAMALDRGVTLTHFDSHQHVHLLPGVMPAAIEIAAAHRLPLRLPQEKTVLIAPARMRLRKLILQARCRALQRAAARRGIVVTPAFLSIFGLSPMPAPAALCLDNYLRVLDEAPEGVTEFMCHPGYVNGPEDCRSISAICAAERAIMMQPAFREALSAKGFVLDTYRALAGAR
jgi:predicted glycoside hydrolase/deacetylase ChbG (UPF0249 family)